jgi:hypothetical protein
MSRTQDKRAVLKNEDGGFTKEELGCRASLAAGQVEDVLCESQHCFKALPSSVRGFTSRWQKVKITASDSIIGSILKGRNLRCYRH